MSEADAERNSRFNGAVLLPSAIAVALFVVLAGLLWTVWIGLTAEPPEVSPAAATEQEPASSGFEPGSPREEAAVPDEPATPEPELPAPADIADAPAAGDEPGPESPPAAPRVATPAVDAEPPAAAREPVRGTAAVPPAPPAPPVPPTFAPGRGLPPAPDPALVEQSPLGPLPRIGPNGLEPWRAYARPFDTRDTRPRVVVILSGLGLSSAATEAAIQGLPGEITLAFQPFADNIQQWIRLARAAGHEVLLNLPMEPVDFPQSDPGPQALFVTLSPDENEDRLRWALSRVGGYVGVVNHMGSRFTTVREAMQPVLAELKARGLLFVDARAAARSVATVLASEMQVPRAINDRFLDDREVSRATIDARLEEIERIAKEAGVSVAIGQAFPVTIERVRVWAETLDEKGLALAPVSAVVDRQADR